MTNSFVKGADVPLKAFFPSTYYEVKRIRLCALLSTFDLTVVRHER